MEKLLEHDQRIKDSGVTVVWVGLGNLNRDFEVQRPAKSTRVTTTAVGATFDFLAETVPQAPKWIQKSGLEWGYRPAQEPKRLAKHYLWGNPQFVKSEIKSRP